MKESMEMNDQANEEQGALSPDAAEKLKAVGRKALHKGPEKKPGSNLDGPWREELRLAAERAVNEDNARKAELVAKVSARIEGDTDEELIGATESFDELEAILDLFSGIQGSEVFFDTPALIDIIEKVRRKKASIESVTRTYGLRAKVGELLGMKAPLETQEEEGVEIPEPIAEPVPVQESAPEEVASQKETVPQEEILEGEPAPESDVEAEAEEELSLEAIGKARIERVLARATEVQDRVQGYGKSLWEKAKDYTVKGAKAIGRNLKKAMYVTFALPEALDASDRAVEEFFGEKYAALIDASSAKYKEIADKVAGVRSAFIERIKAAQDKRQKSRELIETSREEIRAHKAKIAEARKNLLFRML